MYLGSVECKKPHFTKIFFVEIPHNKCLVPLSVPFPLIQYPGLHEFQDQGGLEREPLGHQAEEDNVG